MKKRARGLFVVLDGPDGSGKTTQARLLIEWLSGRRIRAIHLREPGSTSIGEQIRRILLDPANVKMCLKTELFLYMASRAQLVEQVIAPALAECTFVVCERFISASIVYQGIAGGLGMREVVKVGEFAVGDTMPDLVLVMDVDAKEGLARIRKDMDRMEKKELLFHEKVRKGFLTLASREPARYRVIDTSRAITAIHSEIRHIIEPLLA
jgi:dTMP kinase